MADAKTVEIGARVSEKLKAQILAIANQRDEAESVIVREALMLYVSRFSPAPRRASSSNVWVENIGLAASSHAIDEDLLTPPATPAKSTNQKPKDLLGR